MPPAADITNFPIGNCSAFSPPRVNKIFLFIMGASGKILLHFLKKLPDAFPTHGLYQILDRIKIICLPVKVVTGGNKATEPLPAKAGRFGKLLKQPKGSASQLLFFILLFSNFKVVRVTSLL